MAEDNYVHNITSPPKNVFMYIIYLCNTLYSWFCHKLRFSGSSVEFLTLISKQTNRFVFWGRGNKIKSGPITSLHIWVTHLALEENLRQPALSPPGHVSIAIIVFSAQHSLRLFRLSVKVLGNPQKPKSQHQRQHHCRFHKNVPTLWFGHTTVFTLSATFEIATKIFPASSFFCFFVC